MKPTDDPQDIVPDADFTQPYEVVTQASALPETLADLYAEEHTYFDYDKISSLSRDDLTHRYHEARAYANQEGPRFDKEVLWLEAALRRVKNHRTDASSPFNILQHEWNRRRTSVPITWQSVSKVLNDAGFVRKARYSWEQKPGNTYLTTKNSDTAVSVSVESMDLLEDARRALEAAGYTVKNAYSPGTDRYVYRPTIEVVKLHPWQTLDDLQQPWNPPEPDDASQV